MPPTAGSSTAEPAALLLRPRLTRVLSRGRARAACGRRGAGVDSGRRGLEPRSAARRRSTSYQEDVERRAAALGLMALRWPEPFPAEDTELGAAGRDLREVDRPRRGLLAGRAAAGVRRRPRPERARQRPDRRRRVRDAPCRGDQGRGAGEHAAGARRGQRAGARRRRRRGARDLGRRPRAGRRAGDPGG